MINEYRNYAEVIAQFDAFWLDPGQAPTLESKFPHAEKVPVPGSERHVQLGLRPQGSAAREECWLLFIPGLASENGWDEYPECIAKSAFVRCRLKADIDTQALERVWLRAEILDTLEFSDIEGRFAPRDVPYVETWQLSTGSLTRHRDLELWWAPWDDAGYWLLARMHADKAHIVAGGEWLYGARCKYAEAWAGHVVIAQAAWRQICAASS